MFWHWLKEKHPVANEVIQNGILLIALASLIVSIISTLNLLSAS